MSTRTRAIVGAPVWMAMVVAILAGCRGPWCLRTMKQRAGNHPAIVWDCPVEGLHWELLARLCNVADTYSEITGTPLVVTSGRRTLRHQANLMADMSREQLEGMYCSNGYPSYVRDILEARESDGDTDAEDTYRILTQRTEGYISSHLYGGAVDIASEGMDIVFLKALLEQHGFRVLDERSLGIECIHATCRSVPKDIIHK